MPFDLSPGLLAALGLALMCAAFVRGYTGFGFSAIFVAFAALFTDPLPLIPVIFTCEIAMTALQARDVRAHADWRKVGMMLLGAAVFLPVSVGVISSLGEGTARLAVSGIILLMSLILLTGWTIRRRISGFGFAGVGAVSGLCNAAGVGGLPVAAFLAAQPIAAPVFRASMIVYLTGLDLLTMPWLWKAGLISWDTGLAVLMALPFLIIGLSLGSRRFNATSPGEFRRFALMLLLGLACLGLARSLFGG